MFCFFFNDTATTEIYTLSLHDALPISDWGWDERVLRTLTSIERAFRDLCNDLVALLSRFDGYGDRFSSALRSEEHTSELQSRQYLVCRLLLEKKKILLPFLLSSNISRA